MTLAARSAGAPRAEFGDVLDVLSVNCSDWRTRTVAGDAAASAETGGAWASDFSAEDKASMRRVAANSPYFDEDVHSAHEPNLKEMTDERREQTLRIYVQSWV